MIHIFQTSVSVDFFDLLIGFLLSTTISIGSLKYKFLKKSGAIASFILGLIIFSLGKLQWSVPIIIFFVLSSLLSKLRKSKNKEVELYFGKSGVRDYKQVIANGGIGGLLLLVNLLVSDEIFYLAYLASLAAVCADTWATEIGTLNKGHTYNILNFKRVEQGVSGGVSLQGTFGALLGALTIALSGVFWIHHEYIYYFSIIIFAGLFGCFFDSFLGATLQLQNKCLKCGGITERDMHCGIESIHFRGLKFIDNDVVNFLASLSGSAVVFSFYLF